MRRLRIGVDVGGTNTDGVLIDPQRLKESDRGILSWCKTPTTSNPSAGIDTAITELVTSVGVQTQEIASVVIGTTHFVNAVVERDGSRLAKVAVIRLCGPFSKHAPPGIDWPNDLRDLVIGHYALLNGGLSVDGHQLFDIDEAQIRSEVLKAFNEKAISTFVINGVFSPIDTAEKQEERASKIIKEAIPHSHVVCSKDVANLGFLERENASILNASILSFARKTIRSFQKPMARLGLSCPVFITQNDGTMLSGEAAAQLPIRTFSSGPTNSMRGAAFLLQNELEEDVIVVDIGGTTTDIGILHASGFPRQQAAYSELAGVRMNFSCPDIKSIGLGGGSIIRRDGAKMTVGPDSVGYNISNASQIFGGSTLTATDLAVASNPNLNIGTSSLVDSITDSDKTNFSATVKSKLERLIGIMKTTPKDIPVLLVGGGAVVAPSQLSGASRVVKPEWSGVANAIGAATARVGAVIDSVQSTDSRTNEQILGEMKTAAIQQAITAGASPDSVNIAEIDSLPLQYVDKKTRFMVRAVGDFDFSRQDVNLAPPQPEANVDADEESRSIVEKRPNEREEGSKSTINITAYRPDVRNRTWYISETDLEWISIGCYILGTGGGGSPYSSMVRLRSALRNGAVVRVINPDDLGDDDQVGCGGGVGSPTVGIEKLAGDEAEEAQAALAQACKVKPTHIISVEIGGANGLASMILGASSSMDIPVVDGDWMGRAYPTKWQTTPVVFNERSPIWTPVAVADGNGNTVIMTSAASDTHTERIIRAAITEMGSQAAFADPPVTGAETRRWAVEHTISQSWRIGRGVAKARQEQRIDNVAETIIDECGGPSAGKVSWKGKIVGVERGLRNGFAFGECIIEGTNIGESGQTATNSPFSGRIKIPFKNENIAAIRVHEDEGMKDRPERQEDVLAIAPDLITIIDAQNGEAIGTPEYRYGLLVVVLVLAASDKWTGSKRGIELGGPQSFGFGHVEFRPSGTFVKPKSVIDEYNQAC